MRDVRHKILWRLLLLILKSDIKKLCPKCLLDYYKKIGINVGYFLTFSNLSGEKNCILIFFFNSHLTKQRLNDQL